MFHRPPNPSHRWLPHAPLSPLRRSCALRAQGDRFSRDEATIGTAVRVAMWRSGPQQAHAAQAAVMAEMRRIDDAMSPHMAASDLSRVNRDAGLGAVRLSDEMFPLEGCGTRMIVTWPVDFLLS